jgi:hypothetical protein
MFCAIITDHRTDWLEDPQITRYRPAPDSPRMSEAEAPNDEIYKMVIECSILFDDYFNLSSRTNVNTAESPSQFRQTGLENDQPATDSNTTSESQTRFGGEGEEKRKARMDAIKGDFDLWINYTGALAVVGRSLDDRLSGYTDIKEMVLELLQMLARNLQYSTYRHDLLL